MITISLCMIVKNEANTIEKCLNSVKSVVDEIIIVDTGSEDNTKEIVAKFTNKILDFEWIDDFSAARNFAFEHATMDYIMWLDADDIILPKDIVKLMDLKKSITNDVDAVMMKYNIGFDKNGGVTFSYFRERLAKRDKGFKWKEPVHEYLEVYGNVINSDICITHTKKDKKKNDRNIRIYESMLNKGIGFSARGIYYYARELKDNARYEEAIKQFELFLELGQGWVEDNISACEALSKCYQAIHKPQDAFFAMLRSFAFDTPRAEICCMIGYHFKALHDYRKSIFWFELVLGLERKKDSWGFQQEDYWGYIPCIECSVCYDKLGEYKKAEEYNEKAAQYKPNDDAVLYNKQYFESRKKEVLC